MARDELQGQLGIIMSYPSPQRVYRTNQTDSHRLTGVIPPLWLGLYTEQGQKSTPAEEGGQPLRVHHERKGLDMLGKSGSMATLPVT